MSRLAETTPRPSAPFRYALSLYLWLLAAVFATLWLPLVTATYLFERDSRRTRTARLFRALGPAVIRFSTLEVSLSGQEKIKPGQTYVVVANHQSTLDIPSLAALPVDAKWLIKAENFSIPVMSWMMRMAGDVRVERNNRRNAASAWLKCANLLRSGTSIVTFPEGRRSDAPTLLPFLEGPFRLAVRGKIPVLPVLIEGSGRTLPPNAYFLQDKQPIRIHILDPYLPEFFNGRKSDWLRDTVYEDMSARLSALPSRRTDP